MRYLGNKTKLLYFIENVINKYNIDGEVFADLFAGTCSVGDYFKDRYKIIANDYLASSSIICKAKLKNECKPKFDKFYSKYEMSPFEWFNTKQYIAQENYFIYNNYTPIGDRMYFTEDNAKMIDGIRLDIEELFKNDTIDDNEYSYLISSLLESALKVSNTSGTYQAFFKFWEQRAQKVLRLEPLEINEVSIVGENLIYNKNTNNLVREISGDIAYIDPPYTTTQYINSYHMLETVTKYDYPEIFGKTGRRTNREFSGYSNKTKAIEEFEDLFRQLQFKHILVSYSNQSIVDIDELVELARKFAVNGAVNVEYAEYREYATNNQSYKGNGKKLNEVLIYFRKDTTINKSPLNYSGSKDTLIPAIFKQLPKHIGTFVDAMGGAFNVGANVVAIDKVIYNEYNKYVFEIMEMLIQNTPEFICNEVENVVSEYNLEKKNKEAYLSLRNDYNKNKNPMYLFVLQIYAFQNMIRFNNSQYMNTPVGNNEYSNSISERINNYIIKTVEYKLNNSRYQDIIYEKYPTDTLFYFDPPYFITNAEYNDGKRGLAGWDAEKETELLMHVLNLHNNGYKFMISNVISHKDKKHNILIEWAKEHKFNIISVGKTGIKYPREEVVIVNYDIYE